MDLSMIPRQLGQQVRSISEMLSGSDDITCRSFPTPESANLLERERTKDLDVCCGMRPGGRGAGPDTDGPHPARGAQADRRPPRPIEPRAEASTPVDGPLVRGS